MVAGLAPKLEVNDAWDALDNVLHHIGIHCGLPLGTGEVHITTRLSRLAEILQTLNPQSKEEQILAQFSGSGWRIHRHWRTKRTWRGHTGFVIVFQNIKTENFHSVFLPQKPYLRRYELMTATLAMRGQYTSAKSELTAQGRLFEALSDFQRESYITAECVAEQGRSGITYLLRKNRPTLAVRIDPDGSEAVLCALCLHPTGYYTDTWAGVTPPSDEVLTHLLMIRSSEHFFWRKANQISPQEENSGV